ncbi:hypothetical protein Tco_1137850, partial [Tanacetum coccineum]
QCPKPKRKGDATWFRDKVLLVEAQGNGKVLNKEDLEFLADPAKAILMANLSSYGSYVLSEVLHRDNTHNDILNQSVQEMPYSEQTHLVNYPENEITSDSNIIPYSQYLLETQNAAVQDTNSFAQQDAMILFVFEQLSHQVTNCNKINKDNLMVNESLSTELERYKEWVKLLEERKNVDLALGFQNPFYFKKAQQIRPMLYDGNVIAKEINVISIADSEETLMLEEKSRSKMLLKQIDPLVLEKKVHIKPVNYVMSNPSSDSSDASPVKVDVPSELPKVSLVNDSLKKLKFHLTQFDSVVKKRITPDALTEGEWGFEHTKAVFNKEITPFLKSLKDIFNVFDKDLLKEITKVQKIFNQMETAVQQSSVDKRCLEITNKQVLNDNDRLLEQIISQDIVNIVVNSSMDINDSMNVNENVNSMEMCNKCLKLEAELIKQHNMIEKDEYNKLSKSYSQLEQHCISLELAMQLNQEIFQKNNTSVHRTKPTFDQLFEVNNLKAHLQEKDTTIKKLKAHIKRVSETSTSESVKMDIDEIETINIELEYRVAKLIAENEHLKQTYKQLYNLIKPSRIHAKEQTESLVNQVNQKSIERKDIVDSAAQVSNDNTLAPGMCKIDPIILAPRDKNNRETHIYYLQHTMEQAAILREIVEQAKSLNPLDNASYTAWNVTISRVYYVEGLGHNVFYVGQFCDSNLEVAFRKHTCFVRNLEGVDLLLGSRGTNLYSLSINFGALNHLARNGLVHGLPILKFEKDHLCSACAIGKSKKQSHKPKSEDTNQEKLYLLHMALYGPMRVASVNGKRYLLVIVDDYSRFT